MTMHTVADLCSFLDAFAPPHLAAEWDNVGLLVGDRALKVERVMTCLTITPATAAEAIRERADLVVTHHPLPFRPLKRLTADDPAGRLLLDLIRAGVAIHSPHTAFDSAAVGINQQLAEGLGLAEIAPLEPSCGPLAPQEDSPRGPLAPREDSPLAERADHNAPLAERVDHITVGAGRFGRLPQSLPLAEVASRLKQFLRIGGLFVVGDPQMPVERVAVACGSAGEFLDVAIRRGCQLLVTGETRLHTCYEAEARGAALLLAGHYASERFGVDQLAETLARQFPALHVWPSRDERDPLAWV